MKHGIVKRIVAVLFIYLMSLAALPCLSRGADKASPSNDVAEYVIGPEDLLEVSVWKNPDLSREVHVRPDGMISLPLIGEVRASGLTPDSLRKTIVEKIKEYQENALVSVIVKDIGSYKVFVVGEVLKPGTYVLKTKTTVIQSIALAGGFTPYASRSNLVLIRGKADSKGNVEKIHVNFKEIVGNGAADANPVLMAGDTIFVP